MAQNIEIGLIIDDKGTAVIKSFGQKASREFKDLDQQIDRKLGRTMNKFTKESETGLKRMTSAASTLRNAFVGLVAVAGTFRVFGSMIKAASDLQEVTNKFNVVFRGQQQVAEAWTRTLVDGYAMSTREAKQYLSSMQDLLVPMGMQAEAAGKLSNEIVKLAADLGSFNNLPTSQVMLDIQSALVGNYETMKKYGVVLNMAAVQSEALATGLAKSKDQLDPSTKAMAAYQLIVKGSQAAIGDMERSTGTYAKALKEWTAAIEDFGAAIGTYVLPPLTAMIKLLADAIRGVELLVSSAPDMATSRERTALISEISEIERKLAGVYTPVEELYTAESNQELLRRKADIELRLNEISRMQSRLQSEYGGVGISGPITGGGLGPLNIGGPAGPPEFGPGSYGYRLRVGQFSKGGGGYYGPGARDKQSVQAAAKSIVSDIRDIRDATELNFDDMAEASDSFFQGMVYGFKSLRSDVKSWGEIGYYAVRDFAYTAASTMQQLFFDTVKGEFKGLGEYVKAIMGSIVNTIIGALTKIAANAFINWIFGSGDRTSGNSGSGLISAGASVASAASGGKGGGGGLIGSIGSLFGGGTGGGGGGGGGATVGAAAGSTVPYGATSSTSGLLGAGAPSVYSGLGASAGGGAAGGAAAGGGAIGGEMAGGYASTLPTYGSTTLGAGSAGSAATGIGIGVAAILGLGMWKGGGIFGRAKASFGRLDVPAVMARYGMNATEAQAYIAKLGGYPTYAAYVAALNAEQQRLSRAYTANPMRFWGYGIGGRNFQAGGIVPWTGYHKLEKNELVLTPEQARMFAGGSKKRMVIQVPVYLDSEIIQNKMYEGMYRGSKTGRVTLDPRSIVGGGAPAGLI